MKYSIFGESHGPAIGVVLEGNIEKLRRRYPEGFCSEQSIHRDHDDT